MEVGTKLFPAIFVEATSKEVLQFELGRTPTTLPLSAAVLQNSEKHVVPQVSVNAHVDAMCLTIFLYFNMVLLFPQFPPRLKVQILKPHQWSRVPNQSLKVGLVDYVMKNSSETYVSFLVSRFMP